jgi:hypothetical protein
MLLGFVAWCIPACFETVWYKWKLTAAKEEWSGMHGARIKLGRNAPTYKGA